MNRGGSIHGGEEEYMSVYIVTCLRHVAILETQKSVNTLPNNRGSDVYEGTSERSRSRSDAVHREN
jgi:hypothetical protein